MIRSLLVAVVLLPGLILLFPGTAASAPFFDELGNLQPIVLSGERVPSLVGRPIDEIWAYRFDAFEGEFVQIPIQVDERAAYDLTQNIPGGPHDPVYELTYDWLGADDGLMDIDDEIAFMARDAGERAPDTDVWIRQADPIRIEVAIHDPNTGGTGYVYLFTSSTISDTDPAFAYVSYLSTDPIVGAAEFNTPVYSIGYEGRWLLTRLQVEPNPDLLDRIKTRAYAIVGSETEETFQATSVLLGERHGKVRALREVQGAASGPGTTHLERFYRDIWQRTLHLRVHPMPHIWHYYDYAAPQSAGRYYSSSLPAGLPVDGISDVAGNDDWPAWSQVSLPAGTLVLLLQELTPYPVREGAACTPESMMTFYWRDDLSFDDLTGDDASAYGNHGVHLACTSDTNTSAYSMLMTHYFLPPQDPHLSVGAVYAQREENPLRTTNESQTRAGLSDAYLDAVERMGDGRLVLSWTDALGEDGYEVYRGELRSPFLYDHDTALDCNVPAQAATWTSPDDQETGQPSYYYLVVPRRDSTREYGQNAAGDPRPPSASECE